MKKILLAAALILTMAAGQASAFQLSGGYDQPVTLVVNGLTTTAPTDSGVSTWGIFSISSIINSNSFDNQWNATTTDKLYGAIWGLSDINDSNVNNIQMTGGKFAIFETNASVWNAIATSPLAINGDPQAALIGLFGSSPVLTGVFAPDIIAGTVPGTTMVAKSDSVYTPATGNGLAYLDVTGTGTQNWMFENSNKQKGGSDLYFQYVFNSLPEGSDWGAAIYPGSVSGTVVPEPGTMALLGFGMLGLAIFGKRRMNKEA